jgi:glycosyltransferase involved in cell wall biosynthesis
VTSSGVPAVLIVAENASMRMGGEASLPLHYFRHLSDRGGAPHLIIHERAKAELDELLTPDELSRVHLVRDTGVHRALWRIGGLLPHRVDYFTFGLILRLHTQGRQRQVAREVIAAHPIDLIHQPTPVSPREPSGVFGLDRPVVIGPMNGGLVYPPGFRRAVGLIRVGRRLGSLVADLTNRAIPGKRRAAVLVVANRRTADALPRSAVRTIETLVENGVDPDIWRAPDDAVPDLDPDRPLRLVWIGRMMDWKALDIAFEALTRLDPGVEARLDVIGQGPELESLEAAAAALGLTGGDDPIVRFLGWKDQPACAEVLHRSDLLVLPSLYESGGAVILEAMAAGVPSIATEWGGPCDYIDDGVTGVLVPPTSRSAMVDGFASAISSLARDPERRAAMGRAAVDQIRSEYVWDVKMDRMLEIYEAALAAPRPARSSRTRSTANQGSSTR